MRLKYCILDNDLFIRKGKNTFDAVGFYQWSRVFQDQIRKASEIIYNLKDGDFDIIHIRLCIENLDVIECVRHKLGKTSKTLLMISVDIPVGEWKDKKLTKKIIKTSLANADFIFATEYKIIKALKTIINQVVYEIPHPADIKKIQSYRKYSEKKVITILAQKNNLFLRIIYFAIGFLKIKLRFLIYNKDKKPLSCKLWGSEIIVCTNEKAFCLKLAESGIIFTFNKNHNYGKKTIYAAALGKIVVGNNKSDALRRCYPFTICTSFRIKNCLEKYFWLKFDQQAREFFSRNAVDKAEYYNHANMQKKILDCIYNWTGDKRFRYPLQSNIKNKGYMSFFNNIIHVSGKKSINYSPNEFIVVCLVKNGMEYLPSFLRYYNKLGAAHFIFIDNGSTDKTPAFLGSGKNITLYTTDLAHKKYESEIRRIIIEEHCKDRWCLCVDIDEFYDYPYSHILSVAQFLTYLNNRGFTAVVAYMLDMFTREIVFSNKKNYKDIESKYCYYDISQIKKDNYFSFSPAFYNYNKLAYKKLKYYYGGIRSTHFRNAASKYLLIKHPLMFIDKHIEPVTDPHFCNKAYIADVSCILKHYKFTSSFKERVTASIQEKNYYFFAEKEYNNYYLNIKNKEKLKLESVMCRKFISVNDFIHNNFIYVSKDYKKYIQTIQRGNHSNISA